MSDPELNKCYESVKDGKTTYVGRFTKRLGGGRYNTGMADYFLKDGKKVEVVHSYPKEYSYSEVPCKNVNKATGGKRKTRKGGSPIKVSPNQLSYAKNTLKTGLATASFVPGPIGLASRVGSVGLSVYNQGGLNLKDPRKLANTTLKSLPAYKQQMALLNKAKQAGNKYKELMPKEMR